MADYNKLQYSYFLENGAQVVVRGDDREEFLLDVTWAKTEFPVKPTQAGQLADQAREKARPHFNESVTGSPIDDEGFCDGHRVPMKRNKNGKFYHMDQSRPEGDKFCNGYGFPHEKRP